MKRLLITLLILAGTAFAQETTDFHPASKLALIGGVTINVLASFQGHDSLNRTYDPQWTPEWQVKILEAGVPIPRLPGPCVAQVGDHKYCPYSAFGTTMYFATVETHPRPIARALTVSAGTVGALIAEHYIVKKYPRSKKWLSFINYGIGGAVAFQGVR